MSRGLGGARRRLRVNGYRLVLVLAAVYALSLIARQQVQFIRLERELHGVRYQIEEVRREKAALEREIEQMHDRSGIEREARRRLGLTFPEGIPYRVVPTDGADRVRAEAPESD